MRFILPQSCTNCGTVEERVFEDTWTGREFCINCLLQFAERLTNSPQSEGDNLEQLLQEMT